MDILSHHIHVQIYGLIEMLSVIQKPSTPMLQLTSLLTTWTFGTTVLPG